MRGDLPDDGAPHPEAGLSALLAAPLDDRTVAYAIAMRRPFEDLRQAAAQLAGVLVLAAAGSRSAVPDHPMLGLARHACDGARDAIRSAAVPAQSAHHHRHLTRAAAWIGRALEQARSTTRPGGVLDVDGTLPLLRHGWQELHWATGALPGFEIIAFDQACCAHHGRTGG